MRAFKPLPKLRMPLLQARLRWRRTPWVPLLALVAILLAAAGCRSQAVGTSGDAGSGNADGALHDAAEVPTDGTMPPGDGAVACQSPPLSMGFVWQTPVPATHPNPGVEEIEIHGTAQYHGPVTVPIAQSPLFDHEVQIQHPGGQVSVLQYYLPQGLRLPVEVDGDYVLFVRHRYLDGEGVGLVISRNTSGLPPLLFVGDAGPQRVFPAGDTRLSPLVVHLEPDPECSPEPDPQCGGQRVPQRLRFETSTGAPITEAVVRQGESATLPVYGEPFLVLNLESIRQDPPCPDDAAERAVYLVGTEEMTEQPCAPERFWLWDNPAPELGVGDWCDELIFCATTDQATAAAEVAPDVTCAAPAAGLCSPGELECQFPTATPITEGVYAQMCAVSVLADPPERIQCRVYFD